MTELDDILVPVAYDIIQEFGKTVTFNEYASPTVDKDNSTVSLGSATPHVLKVSPGDKYMRKLNEDNTAIESESVEVLLPAGTGATALAFTPGLTNDTNMTVLYDGEVRRIVSIETIPTGDQIGAYILRLER